jgi:hypothetical protein
MVRHLPKRRRFRHLSRRCGYLTRGATIAAMRVLLPTLSASSLAASAARGCRRVLFPRRGGLVLVRARTRAGRGAGARPDPRAAAAHRGRPGHRARRTRARSPPSGCASASGPTATPPSTTPRPRTSPCTSTCSGWRWTSRAASPPPPSARCSSTPILDEITQRPTATFAANLVNRESGAQRAAVLAELAERAGVLFFFRADCPYCEAQAPLLRLLEARYGFAVLPVSLDGARSPAGSFPPSARTRGQAAGARGGLHPGALPRPPAGCGWCPSPRGSSPRPARGAPDPRRRRGRLDQPRRARPHPRGHRGPALDPQALPEPLPEDPEGCSRRCGRRRARAAPPF